MRPRSSRRAMGGGGALGELSLNAGGSACPPFAPYYLEATDSCTNVNPNPQGSAAAAAGSVVLAPPPLAINSVTGAAWSAPSLQLTSAEDLANSRTEISDSAAQAEEIRAAAERALRDRGSDASCEVYRNDSPNVASQWGVLCKKPGQADGQDGRILLSTPGALDYFLVPDSQRAPNGWTAPAQVPVLNNLTPNSDGGAGLGASSSASGTASGQGSSNNGTATAEPGVAVPAVLTDALGWLADHAWWGAAAAIGFLALSAKGKR